MTNKENPTHHEIMDMIASVLRKKGFSLYHVEKDEWEPMKNVTIVPNDMELFQKVISERWYLGSVPDKKKIIIDVVGCLHNGTNFIRNFTIVIEVSCSSDIRKEIIKLMTAPSKWKVVVTKDIEGELEGIPVIHFSKFERFLNDLLQRVNIKK